MAESEWMLPEEAAAEVPCHVATIHRNAGRNGFPKIYYVCGRYRLKRTEWKAYKASPPPIVITRKLGSNGKRNKGKMQKEQVA